MRGPSVRILTSLGVLLLVAACGGSPSTPPGATDAGGGAVESPAAGGGTTPPPDDAAPSGDASQPPAGASTDPGTAGGRADDACALVTSAEVDTAFGVSGSTLQLVDGFPPTCDIQVDGAPLAAIVLVTDGTTASTMYDVWAGDPDKVDIAGLGDRALYAPSNAILIIQRGDRVASLAFFDDGSLTQDERVERLKVLGAAAAGRM
jgi:hypothetical protein